VRGRPRRVPDGNGPREDGPVSTWGPAAYGPAPASDTHAIAKAVAPKLAGLDPAAVTLKVEWLDGSNEEENRVRVTVTTDYQPMLTAVFGASIRLSSTSTVRITH
jgi:hypothetical protein